MLLDCRRAPSTPIVSEARGGASFFFPLACARERSAGRRFGNKLTPRERRRVPYDRHARLPALHCGDFLHGHRTSSSDRRELPLTLSGRHLRRPSSDKSQPSKAAPSSGAGSDRASRSVVTSHGCGRRTLLRQLDVPRRRPPLSKACRSYREGKKKKRNSNCDVDGVLKEGTGELSSAINMIGVARGPDPRVHDAASA